MDCDGLVNIQRSQLPPAEELGGLCGMDLDEVASDGERSRSASPWPEPPPNIMVDYLATMQKELDMPPPQLPPYKAPAEAMAMAEMTVRTQRAVNLDNRVEVELVGLCRQQAAGFALETAKLCRAGGAETDEALQRRLAARCEAVTAAAPEGCPPKAAIRLLLEHIQALSWRFCNVCLELCTSQALVMVARLHGITDLPVFIPNADTYVHEYRDWQSQYEQQAQVNVVLQHAAAADADIRQMLDRDMLRCGQDDAAEFLDF